MAERPWFERVGAWGTEWIESTGLPRDVVLFVVTVLVGFFTALVARRIARRLTIQGARLIFKLSQEHSPPDVTRSAKAVGAAVYWLVLLLTIMAATDILGLPVVSTWFAQVASYLPRVVASIFILVLGIVVAKVMRKVAAGAARSANLPAFERIGHAAEVSILIAVVLVAVEQLGIEISLLTTVVLIVLAAVFTGGALAFGLGGRAWVANVLSAHYVGRLYQVGQTIRVGRVEGKILRFTDTAVILESRDGETAVPASEFAAMPSTLLLKRGQAKDTSAKAPATEELGS